MASPYYFLLFFLLIALTAQADPITYLPLAYGVTTQVPQSGPDTDYLIYFNTTLNALPTFIASFVPIYASTVSPTPNASNTEYAMYFRGDSYHTEIWIESPLPDQILYIGVYSSAGGGTFITLSNAIDLSALATNSTTNSTTVPVTIPANGRAWFKYDYVPQRSNYFYPSVCSGRASNFFFVYASGGATRTDARSINTCDDVTQFSTLTFTTSDPSLYLWRFLCPNTIIEVVTPSANSTSLYVSIDGDSIGPTTLHLSYWIDEDYSMAMPKSLLLSPVKTDSNLLLSFDGSDPSKANLTYQAVTTYLWQGDLDLPSACGLLSRNDSTVWPADKTSVIFNGLLGYSLTYWGNQLTVYRYGYSVLLKQTQNSNSFGIIATLPNGVQMSYFPVNTPARAQLVTASSDAIQWNRLTTIITIVLSVLLMTAIITIVVVVRCTPRSQYAPIH